MRSMIACRLVPVPEMSAPAATTRSLRSLSEQPRRLQRTIRGSAAVAALPNGCSLLPPAATNSRRASRAPHLGGRRCACRSRSPARSPRSPWLLEQTPGVHLTPGAEWGSSPGEVTMAKETLTVTDNRTGRRHEIPIEHGAIRAADLRPLGLVSYD